LPVGRVVTFLRRNSYFDQFILIESSGAGSDLFSPMSSILGLIQGVGYLFGKTGEAGTCRCIGNIETLFFTHLKTGPEIRFVFAKITR